MQQVRRSELVAAIGKPCCYCGEPMAAPIRMTPDCELYRLILDFEALQDAFADRIDDLNVPLTEVDAAGQLTRGNTQKLLCKSDAKWARKFGWESLGKILKGTGTMSR